MTEKAYKVPLPAFKSLDAHGIDLHRDLSDPVILSTLAKANSQYLHWEELKYKNWIPEKFANNKEAFWGHSQKSN